MEIVLDWISIHGYYAIFVLLVLGIVGLPVPDETLLVFSGSLIAAGRLHPLGTFLAALAGSMCGITISYWLGRTLGLGVVHKFGRYLHVDDAKLARLHAWFDRIGHWVLFVGYYIAGVRHFSAVIAGTSGVGLRDFALYAYSGAFVWISTFLGIGYLVGENWRHILAHVHQIVWVVTGLAALAAAAYALRWWSRKRSSAPPD